jgi:hypothetical protein
MSVWSSVVQSFYRIAVLKIEKVVDNLQTAGHVRPVESKFLALY